MSTVDFVPFATGAGANVESQATYVADPTTADGQQTGLAKSAIFNKIWRQGNWWGAVAANVISQVLSISVLDDGNLTAAITNFKNMVTGLAWASPALTGTATAPTVSGTADNTTKIATTAFIQAVRALLAPLTSPAFLGTPTTPTPLSTDNSTTVVNSAWFRNFLSSSTVTGTFTGLTTSSTQSVAHGLGGAPVALYAFLVCTSADQGYAVGDQLTIPADVTSAVWANATLMGFSISNTGLSSVPKAGGATAGLTLSKWNLKIIARSY